MMGKLVPWLLGGAAVAFFAGAASASQLKMAPPPPPPTPVPPPSPPPPPTPNPSQAILLAQLQILMQQAAVNANAVDPQQLETLSYSLDAAGLPQQAAQARDLAMRIRLSRGTPPTPTPRDPGVLLAQYTALLQQAMSDPAHTDPVLLDQLAIELDGAGMGYQAQILRAAAAEVRRKRQNIPTGT